MGCYHPLIGKATGLTENGKVRYNIMPYDESALDLFPYQDVKLIPCGHCIGCRLEYAQRWSNRILMEAKMHDSNYFVTLTYDEKNVPKVRYNDIELETLSKRDIQLFMKRLRQAFPDQKISYYFTGEYGSQTFRPHYHGVIFGLRLPDATPTGTASVNGESVMKSEKLDSIWKKGFTELGSVTPASASYVARYVLKKVGADRKDEYEARGQQPEFSLMSRNPAVGRRYFDEHKDMFDNGKYYLSTSRGSVKIIPDRYFKKLSETQDQKIDNYLKSKFIRLNKKKMTDLTYEEILKNEEKTKINQTSILKNKKIK